MFTATATISHKKVKVLANAIRKEKGQEWRERERQRGGKQGGGKK